MSQRRIFKENKCWFDQFLFPTCVLCRSSCQWNFVQKLVNFFRFWTRLPHSQGPVVFSSFSSPHQWLGRNCSFVRWKFEPTKTGNHFFHRERSKMNSTDRLAIFWPKKTKFWKSIFYLFWSTCRHITHSNVRQATKEISLSSLSLSLSLTLSLSHSLSLRLRSVSFFSFTC